MEQTSVSRLEPEEHRNHGICLAHTSHFQVMVCWPQHMVVDCGKPSEFESWTDMLDKAGGLQGIIDKATLHSEMRLSNLLPATAKTIADYCRERGAPAYPVTGFCCFHLCKRLFPWVGQDMSPAVVKHNFARLHACMATLENVWTRVGFWADVLAAWTGCKPDSGDR